MTCRVGAERVLWGPLGHKRAGGEAGSGEEDAVGIGLTLQQVEGWQGQYQRMLRWHRRVIAAANGEPSADEVDFLLAFFESAHHLRDWLVRTGAVSTADLESFASAHVEIGICRDIANGFKHHSISRSSVDAEFAIVRQYVDPIDRGRPYRYPNGEWTVLAGGHQLSLVPLSETVVQLWSGFLRAKALSIDPEDISCPADRSPA